jgi:hypothetical protein
MNFSAKEYDVGASLAKNKSGRQLGALVHNVIFDQLLILVMNVFNDQRLRPSHKIDGECIFL